MRRFSKLFSRGLLAALVFGAGAVPNAGLGPAAQGIAHKLPRGGIPIGGGSLDIAQPANNKTPVYSGTQTTVTGADATGATNSATVFEAASAAFVSGGCGTFIVPPGTYQIGRQVAGLNSLLYDGVPSIKISGCTNPVVVDIRGVTFKTANGLKFGAFDPDNGQAPIDITTFAAGAYPHPPIAYAAQIGKMIDISGNTGGVEVWGSGPTTLFDGNISNTTIGGLWHAAGDGGIALQHYGFSEFNNSSFKFWNGADAKHFGTDGFTSGWTGITTADTQKFKYFENIRSYENGRLGFSWVGGNHMNMVWSEFRRNGMPQYTNGISSVPLSGMDIENETSFNAQQPNTLSNGTFTRVILSDNYGAGIISASGQARDHMTWNYSTFDAGHGNTSMVPAGRYWVLNHCLLVGAFNGLLTQQGMIDNGGAGTTAEAMVVNDSTFDVHASASLAGLTHEWADSGAVAGVNTFAVVPQVNLAGYGPKFNRTTFNIDNFLLDPDHNTTTTATYTDDVFNGAQSGAPIWGIFNGTNNINYVNPVPGFGNVVQNLSNIVKNGPVFVNGVAQ